MRFKLGKYARVRAVYAEYGFPLGHLVCGKLYNGQYYLTSRTRAMLRK